MSSINVAPDPVSDATMETNIVVPLGTLDNMQVAPGVQFDPSSAHAQTVGGVSVFALNRTIELLLGRIANLHARVEALESP